jgi:hypothetical protein
MARGGAVRVMRANAAIADSWPTPLAGAFRRHRH